jgi:CheY-like chemotaxis protein
MANPRSQPPATQRPPRILIIEDELLIALLIEEMVREIGYRVSRVAYTMAIARQEFVKRNFDAVLLDINIGGRYQPEVADFLQNMGVPFAFVTGYDYLIVPRHQTVPVLQKPFTVVQLRALLEMLVSPGALSGEMAQTVSTSMRVPPRVGCDRPWPHVCAMSALPPKADMCGAAVHVRFVPIADIALLFDHLVGATDERVGNIEAQANIARTYCDAPESRQAKRWFMQLSNN